MEDREYELKQAEVALKEREVAAREREVTAKEKESHVTWWKNPLIPLIVGLIGAALALAGNIITNVLSNRASDKAERVRAQANLVLSVIKTNGNEEDACKNLNFFVRIGWLDDPNKAIHNVCGTKGQGGVPTLPAGGAGDGASAVGGGLGLPTYGVGSILIVRVEDADSHEPIDGAVVQLAGISFGSALTNAKGEALLNFVYPSESLTVRRDGYRTETQFLSQSVMSKIFPIITIDLHRVPK